MTTQISNGVDKKKLNTFIRLLQKVRKQPSQTFDLGLIIKEPKSKTSRDEILKAIEELINIEEITYDYSITDEEVFDKTVLAFEKKKWVFLEIKRDIGSSLLNQLKHLANYNSFQLLDYKDKVIFQMKMPEESRIIVFTERDFIEGKITYPHFYRLFGPTLNIK